MPFPEAVVPTRSEAQLDAHPFGNALGDLCNGGFGAEHHDRWDIVWVDGGGPVGLAVDAFLFLLDLELFLLQGLELEDESLLKLGIPDLTVPFGGRVDELSGEALGGRRAESGRGG